jgi:hypothetical protein
MAQKEYSKKINRKQLTALPDGNRSPRRQSAQERFAATAEKMR